MARSKPGSTTSSSASDDEPRMAPAWVRRNWLAAASSAPMRDASRRAASAVVSAARAARRAVSVASSAPRSTAACAMAASRAWPTRASAATASASSPATLGLELLGVTGGQRLELGLERLDALTAGLVGGVLDACASSSSSWRSRRSTRSASIDPRLRHTLQAHPRALGGAARSEHALGERLALLGALGQSLLGLVAAGGDLAQTALRLIAARAGGDGGLLGGGQRRLRGAGGVAGQLPAGLQRLALDALVQLGGLGLGA